MKLEKIVYVTRLTIPKKGPRSLQIVKTCVALANQNVRVDLYVKRYNFKNVEDFYKYYGLRMPDNLKIKVIPTFLRTWRMGIAMAVIAKSIFKRNDSVFYLRDHKLAKDMLSLRWLHRIPVFFESHESFPIEFENGRNKFKANKSLNCVYRKSNGLMFVYDDTKSLVYNNSIRTPAIFAWHGTKPIGNFNYSFSSRNGIHYVGNLSPTKYRVEVLLEAMKYVETEKLILIGGYKEEDISRIKHQAKNLGVLERVEFKGYVPPGEIKNYLGSARVVISLLWGSKLSDYLSYGLPIIIPEMVIVKDVFRDGENCIMFQLNDARSLAKAINSVLSNPTSAEELARAAYETAQKYTWQKRAERIINFIESNTR